MRFLYSLLLLLGTPFVLLYFVMRGVRDQSYFGRWGERFGLLKDDVPEGGVLLHAASVGEVNAANPLIRALLKTHPELPVTVTTLTPTGSDRLRHEFGDRVFNNFIPIDLPWAVSRFLNRLKPRLIIIIETEIWPNLYLHAKTKGIPLVMVNARLSARSSDRLGLVSGFTEQVLSSVAWIGAQSTQDAQRLVDCGAKADRTCMTGNLKFDLGIPDGLLEKGFALRSHWKSQRPVLVAGSTHEADENVLLPAFIDLLKALPDALLILVPRRPERFGRVIQAAKDAGLATELRSQREMCSREAQCFVIDTLGELLTYYACADVAFVGGSIGDQGGHNALEPAALGKPVLLGPNMPNAREIADQLLGCNAARQVSNSSELQQAAELILNNTELRDQMGQSALALVESNKGALNTSLQAINKYLQAGISQ